MEPVKTDTVTISYDNGQWKITPPIVQRKPGDPIKWVFDKSNASVEAEEDKAYFQFPPDLLIEKNSGAKIDYRRLEDRFEVLETEVIDDDALKRAEPYYYAIFIHDAFVRGHNPPPQIIVGP